MFVNRIKVRFDNITTGTSINVPLTLNFTPTDNSELVEDKFVKDEVEKAINPIVDYKKVRLRPATVINGVWEIIDEFKLQNTFLIKDQITNNIVYTNSPSNYEDIGFIDDDVFCRTNRLMKSFLTLSFFDSPNTQTNRLLYFNTVFTQIEGDQKEETGQTKPASDCPISYVIGDPILKPDTEHEGFHIYWYKDLIDNAPNKEYEMYMTATFNNANNGWSTAMYTLPTNNIDDLQIKDVSGPNGGLYLKVILKYDDTDKQYKYTFEKLPIQTGVDWNSSSPTITFYQIIPNEV